MMRMASKWNGDVYGGAPARFGAHLAPATQGLRPLADRARCEIAVRGRGLVADAQPQPSAIAAQFDLAAARLGMAADIAQALADEL